MPLPPKGLEILNAMAREYGAAKGKRIFYASINKGKLRGADPIYERKRGLEGLRHPGG